MTAPALAITVEPTDGDTAYYLPLVPAQKGDPPQFKLVLRLRITNNEGADVFLNGVFFAFPFGGVPNKDMQGIQLAMSYPAKESPKDGRIGSGASTVWSSGRVNLTPTGTATWIRNEVYADLPAPASVTVRVSADGFDDPAETTVLLAPFPDPAMALPFRADDLRAGEFVATSAEHATNGGANGGQIYAHDIGIVAMLGDGETTDRLDPNAPFAKENYRIWDLAVYSMAPGTVVDVLDGVEDNNGKVPLGGNSVTIDHGGVTAVYCHFKKGSVVVVPDQEVDAGTKLGTVGWSGNTDFPHLHIALTETSTGLLRGISFKDAHVLDLTQVEEDGTGEWAPMEGTGIPREGVAIYPGKTLPLNGQDLHFEGLIAQLFGGVDVGGGGWVFIGGKFIKIPPRGPIWELLEVLVAIEATSGLPRGTADPTVRTLAGSVADIARRIQHSIH